MEGGISRRRGGWVHVYRDRGIWIECCLYIWSFSETCNIFLGVLDCAGRIEGSLRSIICSVNFYASEAIQLGGRFMRLYSRYIHRWNLRTQFRYPIKHRGSLFSTRGLTNEV